MGHGVIGAPVAEDRDPGRGGAAGELRTGLGLPTVAAEDERRTGGGGDAGGQRFEFGGGGLRFGQLGEGGGGRLRSEEHTSELQSRFDLVCRLLLEIK